MEETIQKPDTPEIKEVRADFKKFAGLGILAETDGGKTLIDTLKQAIADDVTNILSLADEPEMKLRCTIYRLKANLNILRALQHAPANAKLAEEELSKLLELQKED